MSLVCSMTDRRCGGVHRTGYLTKAACTMLALLHNVADCIFLCECVCLEAQRQTVSSAIVGGFDISSAASAHSRWCLQLSVAACAQPCAVAGPCYIIPCAAGACCHWQIQSDHHPPSASIIYQVQMELLCLPRGARPIQAQSGMKNSLVLPAAESCRLAPGC